MKLKDVILLSLSAALVIVGTHVTMNQGILFSYPIFMIAIALLFWYQFRKGKNKQENELKSGSMSKGKKTGKKKYN